MKSPRNQRSWSAEPWTPPKEQQSRLGEMIEDFVVRYPHSDRLWTCSTYPYAQMLLSRAVGEITTVSADADRHYRERSAAEQALDGKVSVDTSVVALGVHTGLDIRRTGAVFGGVLAASELVIDARAAVAAAKQPVHGILRYNSGLGRLISAEIGDQQKVAMLKAAEQALEMLEG